ncbi:hypothetical protein [Nocardioides sp. BYT-33-1]|jgi:hypothetical protein|uniref:hypothetical protein n=1 Tax=Nocardioides sp. BYT-33-1 TaxID=3416952 RepID=UPI003F531727
MPGPVTNPAAEPVDETFPVLSTLDRRAGRMTQLLPGRPVGRFTGRLWTWTLSTVVVWALAFSVPCAAFLGLAPGSLGSPWAILPGLVLAYLVLSSTLGLGEQVRAAFGQVRLPGLLVTTIVTGSFALTALGWLVASYADEPEPAFELSNIATSTSLPRELLALLACAALAWALLAAARLVSAFRHARSRQATIERLRRHGTRHHGVLTEREFGGSWLYDKPAFTIRVAYDDQGGERVVRAFMRTLPAQVPVLGSPVVVLTDEDGTVHVELDRSSGVAYETDYGRFEPSDG